MFENLFKRQKWGLVHTFLLNNYRSYYIHCFESNLGNRKIECHEDGKIRKIDTDFKSSELYQRRIYRWLKGRRDLEIPTYDQIPEEETANFLKGIIK